MIAFALLYGAMGIFPMRTRWAREDRVVVQKEEPAKFRGLLVLTVAVGGGILVWGILQSRRQ